MAVFVVLSESKVGYLLLAVISIWEVVKFIKAHKNKWLIPIAAAVFVGGGILVYTLMPSAVQRISKTFEVMSKPLESYDKTGAESTTARLFVWDASVDLIKENFWFRSEEHTSELQSRPH